MSDLKEEENSMRLFFGAQVQAPWPKDYPPARMIPEETRHVTLAFLGQNSFSKFEKILPSIRRGIQKLASGNVGASDLQQAKPLSKQGMCKHMLDAEGCKDEDADAANGQFLNPDVYIPRPSFVIGPAGIAKELIFLPKETNRVVALSIDWLDTNARLNSYQKELSDWLQSQGYTLDKRPFFPHLTIARAPFDKEQWQEHFTPLPFFIKAIHLYQSLGNLQYQSLWESSLLSPFDEFEHTADIAFLIRGYSVQELHQSAQLALAFKFPPMIKFYTSDLRGSLDEIIISLNEMVALADTEFGCPFKAVSFHGTIKSDEHPILHWEMIVDV